MKPFLPIKKRLTAVIGMLLFLTVLMPLTGSDFSPVSPVFAQSEDTAQGTEAENMANEEIASSVNKADSTWVTVSTLLVVLMALPGLALFYGGMVRGKNLLSVLTQVFVVFSLIFGLWIVYGYSVAFTGGTPWFGGFDKLFLAGVTPDSLGATFTKEVYIPELTFVAFQGTFAAITTTLIVGAFAERIRFTAVLLFSVIWFSFSYLPIAHMVWFWDGPDSIFDAASLDAVTQSAGWLWSDGALDFAGGTVVHINAGIAGLVGAYLVGKRLGYGTEPMMPNNLPFTMIGGSLLWVGWFGFNAGSALEMGGIAALAFINTMIASAMGCLSWVLSESFHKHKPSLLGAVSGSISGLVIITPAAGFVGPGGALIMGIIGGFTGWLGVNAIKRLLRVDDSLDVFAVHGICGIAGAILTGVFAAPALGGTGLYDYITDSAVAEYSIGGQVWIQLTSVLITIVWSGIVSLIAYKLVDLTIGLRVSEEDERTGLDTVSHGETAFNR